METALLVVRWHNIVEQLENVSHSEEELQSTAKKKSFQIDSLRTQPSLYSV